MGQLESYRNFGNGTLFERKKTEMNLNCNLRKLRGPSSHSFQREVCFSQHMVGFERLLGGGKKKPTNHSKGWNLIKGYRVPMLLHSAARHTPDRGQ